uniref:Thymidylate kinase n=1 Tax=Ciona intestinalis TaxID=7719 RepID=F6SK91_CIOIN|nr:thymidylate kinase-like [Ciona intestinalis]|eukprot:XP_026695821.1 thymidylate kinase-like [Ciona intestinalis]
MKVGRGALIVVEGLDRSGKTTQCQKLITALNEKNQKVKLLKFPDRTTEIGKTINSYLVKKSNLDDRAIHLLFSANRWEKRSEMLQDLNDGVTLIVDRYAYSGAAFSAAKKGLELDWCKSPDSGLPQPDLVLFLELSTSVAATRGGYGEERYETTEFQKKVALNFHGLKTEEWKVIDAGRDMFEVHQDMLSFVEKTMEKVKLQPVGTLWT